MAYATGLVNQELLLQNEYLAAENGILRAHLRGLRLSDGERATLAEIGKRLGRKGLQQVARIAKPDKRASDDGRPPSEWLPTATKGKVRQVFGRAS